MPNRPPRRGGGLPPRRPFGGSGPGAGGRRPGGPGGRPFRPGNGPPRKPFRPNLADQGGPEGGPPPRPTRRPAQGGPGGGGGGPKPQRRREQHAQREDDGTLRLNKVLAHAGYGSRRAAEELILQGRVTIDGQIVREMGTRVDPEKSKVEVDGERIKMEKSVYIAVHKPKGHVSTNNDPAGRPRVVDLLPELNERVYTVGRLDEDSTGLILLTNDGQLANRLAHPRYGIEKVYRAQVAGHPDPSVLDRLIAGVWLSDGKARARRAKFAGKQGDSTVIELVLAEGKNREVRRMLAKLGHKVMSLSRISVGPIRLKGLESGQFRHLSAEEVDLLRKAAAGELAGPAPREDRPARSDRDRNRPPVGGGVGLGNLLGSEGDRRGRRPFGPGGGMKPRPSRAILDDEGGEDDGPPRRPRGQGDGPPSRGPGDGPPGRGQGDQGPRRTARPGLYESKNFRRAGRDEADVDEILVSPIGDGDFDGPPPRGRRPFQGGPPQGGPGERGPFRGGPPPRGPFQGGPGGRPPFRGGQGGRPPFQGGPPPRRRPFDQEMGEGGPPPQGRRPFQGGPGGRPPFRGGQGGRRPFDQEMGEGGPPQGGRRPFDQEMGEGGPPPRRPFQGGPGGRPPFRGGQGGGQPFQGGPPPRRRPFDQEMGEGGPPPQGRRPFQGGPGGRPPFRGGQGGRGPFQGGPPQGGRRPFGGQNQEMMGEGPPPRPRRPAPEGPPPLGGRRVVGLNSGEGSSEGGAGQGPPNRNRPAGGPPAGGPAAGGPPPPRRPKPLSKPRRRPRPSSNDE